MKILSFFIFILTLCGGCLATNLDIKRAINDGERSLIYVKNYTIGNQLEAYIGQPIIRWQEGFVGGGPEYIVFDDDFSLKFDYHLPYSGFSTCTIVGKRGNESEIQLIAEYDDKKYNILEDKCDTGYAVGLLIDEDGKLNDTIFSHAPNVYIDNKGYQMHDATLSPPTTHFTKYAKPDMRGGITRELTFGGVNNVSVNITYREYSPDNMARQAFYQNVTYQTSASIIRFQNFKIKVHKVTNEKIVFTVLEDGLGLQSSLKER